MDPTRQRGLSTSKRRFDKTMYGIATYLVPAAAALGTMLGLHQLGAEPNWAVTTGAAIFSVVAYEAVTSYRHELVLPRRIDSSLDPDADHYFTVVAVRAGLAASATAIVVAAALIARVAFSLPVGEAGAVVTPLLIGLVWIRERHREETFGSPRLTAGTIGNRMKPVRMLRRPANKLVKTPELAIPWGGLRLDVGELLKNFLVIGSVGSGKTLVLKQWLAQLLPGVAKFPKWRAIVIDPKSEFYAWCLALVPAYKLKMVNPGDARSHVWNISKDLTTTTHAHEASYLLIPQDHRESQRFFTDAARRLLYGVIVVLMHVAPKSWRFSDVFYVLRSLPRLKTVLSLHPEGKDILDTYAKSERTFGEVHATLDSRIQSFMPIAARWSYEQEERPSHTISVSDWLCGNFVLLIAKSASAETAETALIALLLKRAAQGLLDGPTGQSTLDPRTSRRTIVAVEEAPRAGKLDIVNLATNGRDYGVGIALSAQSVEAMQTHYDKPSDFDAVANEFHSTAFLHTNSPTTARWMSERVGKIEEIRRRPQGQSDKAWVSTVEPTFFQLLAQGSTISPDYVPGIFTNSTLGAWYSEEGVELPPPASGVPQLVPAQDRPFRDWDENDLRRLNLTSHRGELNLPTAAPSPSRPKASQPTSSTTRFRP